MNFTPGGQSALLRPWHFPRPPPLALSPSKPAVPAEKSTLRYLRLVPLRKLAPYPKMGPKEARAMKKVLWSITAATLILTLTGCAGTAGPVQSENCPPQPAAVTTPELSALSTQAIESEPVSFSASNKLPVGDSPEDSAASEEPTPSPGPPAKPSASPVPDTALAPAPRETQAPAVEETPPPK